MTARSDHELLLDMTPPDSCTDHPEYLSTELADLIDRQVRGEDVEWPDSLDLTECVRPTKET